MRRDESWAYSDAALDQFPRYNVLQAILAEIETRTGEDLGSLSEARAWLIRASETRRERRYDHPIEAAAAADERRRFIAFVAACNPASEVRRPLPFRRTLADDEHQHLHALVRKRWGRWYGGWLQGRTRQSVVTIHVAGMRIATPARSATTVARCRLVRCVRRAPTRELPSAASFAFSNCERTARDTSSIFPSRTSRTTAPRAAGQSVRSSGWSTRHTSRQSPSAARGSSNGCAESSRSSIDISTRGGTPPPTERYFPILRQRQQILQGPTSAMAPPWPHGHALLGTGHLYPHPD